MASSEIPVNNEVKDFWESIFQKTNITEQLMNLAENNSSSMNFKFELFDYGKVQITAKPAVPLGTNFMSDVFITSAYLENGKHHAAFVKVVKEMTIPVYRFVNYLLLIGFSFIGSTIKSIQVSSRVHWWFISKGICCLSTMDSRVKRNQILQESDQL